MINYYVPQPNIENKAKTAIVGIDYFKKRFRVPIDEKLFYSPFVEPQTSTNIPQLKWQVIIPTPELSVEGFIEAIIIDKTNETDIVHILVQPYNSKQIL